MREQVLAWLADRVPAARIKHILGVEQMSIELALHYQLDEKKAGTAGLMHDLAKYFKPSLLLQMAREEGLELDPVDEENPHLLHADVSAIVARDKFGIFDEEILQAIQDHTLGRPGMSELSCIVFLADTLEPGRGNTPELEALRQVAWQNLYKAVWLTCDYSLKYLLETRCLIHPRTIRSRNWALQIASKKQQPEAERMKDK
ncbi:bis(5'-nucleosyl)-tetraphosphatase (symmetrical) YqeK [Trichocoleus sp. DQ-A3]|uniref:bis(5'-nucleosyl)-tetraphosphatase (symmetrical) YqeK n=1 Tax=Cyanophyceae TaxID=3028117 RepID=UPI00168971B4|nr:bis(5'-nucleosyl)-tetraphosphatase (symmetrical) YqeK [Coleofasciculus sp. FACHB-125]MBD1900966.1 bis(5'-nucleosyl)-tetraphosphatase (symmetrical) YqeK [Coleofasciculus sp. FACHB-125]